jgi:hypothetical protein
MTKWFWKPRPGLRVRIKATGEEGTTLRKYKYGGWMIGVASFASHPFGPDHGGLFIYDQLEPADVCQWEAW